MANYRSNIETQTNIYPILRSRVILMELLNRVKSRRLETDILNDIMENNSFHSPEFVNVHSDIKYNEGTDDVYIIININYNNNHIGHFTLHLIRKKGSNNFFGNGPIHVSNNTYRSGARISRNARRRIRLHKQFQGGEQKLTFMLGNHTNPRLPLKYPIPEISNSILNTFNKYFDPSDTLYLKNKLDSSDYDTQIVGYANIILGQKMGGRHKFTRKLPRE